MKSKVTSLLGKTAPNQETLDLDELRKVTNRLQSFFADANSST